MPIFTRSSYPNYGVFLPQPGLGLLRLTILVVLTLLAFQQATAQTCGLSMTVSPGSCVAATNSYVLSGTIVATNVPTSGTLTISSGSFASRTLALPIGNASGTFSYSGLVSNGQTYTVTASYSNSACAPVSQVYTAPASCSITPACSLTGVATAGLCASATNTYSTSVVVSLANAPAGTLTVSIPGASPISQPIVANTSAFTAVFAGLPSDGSSHTATITLPNCGTITTTYTAPASCSVAPVCSLTATSTPGLCQSATNTYTNVVVVRLTNPTAGLLTVTDGPASLTFATTAVSSATYTATFNSILSDGLLHTVTTNLPGCSSATTTYTAPASCSTTPACSVGTPTLTAGSCSSATNTYSVTAVVAVQNPASGGTLTLSNGATSQPFTTTSGTSNTFTMVFNGLVSDGIAHTITTSLPGCGSAIATYTAPVSCSLAPICSITPVVTAGQCSSATNTYSTTAVVRLSNPPAGVLTVTDGPRSLTTTIASGLTSFTFTATFSGITADGTTHTVVASLPGCTSQSVTYTAPASCSVAPACSVSAVATHGLCASATNTFSNTVTVTLTNPTAGTLTVTDGPASLTYSVPATLGTVTVSSVFNGLLSNGATRTVNVSLPGCSNSTLTYTAPVSCSTTPTCSVGTPTLTAGTCASATNTYSVTAVVTVQNPANGNTLTISNGITSQPFTTTAGSSNTFTMVFNGLTSNGLLHTITATVAGCGSTSATYTAPASCSAVPICSINPVVTVGVCASATNTYSTTAVVTLTNPPAGVLTVTNGASILTTTIGSGLSSFTYTAVFNALLSDGVTHTVTASLPGCGSATVSYTAPASCSVVPPSCSVGTPVVTAGTCLTATNTYSATAVVTLSNTTAGVLTVTNGAQSLTTNVAGGLSSFTFTATFNGLPSNGASRLITASLTGCGSASATYTAPASCSTAVICSINPVVTVGTCASATNTYSTTAVVTLANPPAGILTVSNGASSLTTTIAGGLSSFTYTATFNGLPSTGTTQTITATLPGCSSATAQYTAPASCTQPSPVFDLALTKTLAIGQIASVTPGSDVTFTITVFNQGNVTATNIQITDYFPANIVLNDPSATWTVNNGTATLFTPIASLAPNTSATRNIIFRVNSDISVITSIINRAEISSATGGNDIDSDADNNPDNDAGGSPNTPSDNATGGNGTGTIGGTDPATDEDDADPVIITVTPTPVCSISPVVTTGQCATATNTYSATVVVTLANVSGGGTLTVTNGGQSQTLPVAAGLGGGTYTAVFTGLVSDGSTHAVTVSLPGCGSATTTYFAPASCTSAAVCSISPVVTVGPCVTIVNTYSTTAVVTLTNPPAGILTVSTGGQSLTTTVASGLSSFTYTAVFNGLIPTGLATTLTASLPGCGAQTLTYTTPVSCAPACPIGSLNLIKGPCMAATNTYSVTVTVPIENPMESNTLTIRYGGPIGEIIPNAPPNQTFIITAGVSTTYTAVINGLPSDGDGHGIAVELTGCNRGTIQYLAPVSCSVAGPCSISAVVTAGQCASATNTYSLSALVTLTNPPAGILTVGTGSNSLSTTVGSGLTSFTYTGVLNGLISTGGTQTAYTSLPGCVVETTPYTAPLSCSAGSCLLNPPVITVGQCNTATNTYSVTATVTGQNPPSGSILIVSHELSNQSFTTTSGSSFTHTVIFNGLISDGSTNFIYTALASDCASFNIPYTAPARCSTADLCIVSTPVITVGQCNTATNTYSVTATVAVQNPVVGQTLTISNGVTNQLFPITSASSTTITAIFTGLVSNGANYTITAGLPRCDTATVAYTAPASCSVGTPSQNCSIGQLLAVGSCSPATNMYSVTALVSLNNPPAGVLTVSNGVQSLTTSIGSGLTSFTYTAVLNGLSSNGSTNTITAYLPGCGQQTSTYTAPASCSIAPPCSINVTAIPGPCVSGQYSVTAVIEITNPASGELFVRQGRGLSRFSITAGSSTTITDVSTYIADNAVHAISASLEGAIIVCSSGGTSYTAPAPCSMTPPCPISAVVTAGPCQTATNTYSVTAIVTTLNPENGNTITISDGITSQPFTTTFSASGSFTAVFSGLTSDGLTHAITATRPGCGSATTTYTAPASCSSTTACPPFTLSPASLANGSVGTPYNVTLVASGGTGPYSFSVSSGVLPTGLTLSPGGVLSGTPLTTGSFGITVRVSDNAGCFHDLDPGILTISTNPNCPPTRCVPLVVKRLR